MKKTSVLVCAATLLAGCVSLKPPPSIMLSPVSTNPAFTGAFQQINMLQHEYAKRADGLSNEAVFFDGLSITSQVATLGFAAYEAHPDNIAAAALVSGVTGVSRTRFDPRVASVFYAKGINALTCIGNRANEIRYTQPAPAGVAGVNVRTLAAASLGSVDDYGTLLELIHLGLIAAAEVVQPSDRLKAATADAQLAKTKLLLGIEAQNTALASINDAVLKVHGAVSSQSAPDIKSILEDISKIKLPTSTTPAGSSSGAGAQAQAGIAKAPDASKQAQIDAFLTAQAADSNTIAIILEILVMRVTRIRPEGDAEAINRLKACVASFGAAS